MSVKYEMLKALVKAIGIKRRWNGSVEELLENRRKANAKNKIPELHDPELTIDRITVCGCPVVTMKHKNGSERANLFIIGGGMISAPRPGSVKKALRFARETGLDLYVPYYPLCTDYPLTKAYEMIHETYREMLRHYTQKAYPQTVAREFKGLEHAELVLMFPERFYEETTRFLRED